MYLHWYLNILVNLVIDKYLQNAYCIRQIYDTVDKVHLSIPHFITKDVNNFNLDKQESCRHFVLECEDSRECFTKVETVIKIDSDGMYNSRKYLIIINNDEAYEEFFNSTWLTFVRDILIIHASKEDFLIETTNKLIPEGYYVVFKLYTHRYIGIEGNNDPILLDIWYGHNQSFQYGNNLYPDKITNQMGRELRAPCYNTLPYAICDIKKEIGNEHNIILKYASRYNFTLNIFPELTNGIAKREYGEIFPNWTSYGMLDGLIREDDHYDIIYGGFRGSPHIDVIRSVVYTYEVSVPIHRLKYGWLWIFKMFSPPVWLLLFLVFLTIYFIIKLRRYLFKEHSFPRSQMQTIEIFGLFVNQASFPTQEWQNSSMLRFLSLVIMFSSILYGAAYNSRLSSVMMIPIYEHDIQTLAECAKSNYKLLFFDNHYDILAEDTRKIYKRLYQKIYQIPSLKNGSENYQLSKQLLNSQEYAVACFRRSTGEYNERYQHLLQMYGKFKPITPELFTDYYYLLLRKNSMHTGILSNLVTSATEGGLMAFWEQDAIRYGGYTTLQKIFQDVRIYDAKQNLNMKNLMGAFEFWMFCISIAMIVFLIELYFSKKAHFSKNMHCKIKSKLKNHILHK